MSVNCCTTEGSKLAGAGLGVTAATGAAGGGGAERRTYDKEVGADCNVVTSGSGGGHRLGWCSGSAH